ncbi:TBC1 domain family member 10B [Pseudophryne corroboree]|uniref:TBC1 domain family member 10B n=1 Tax=Pseudophryne corroboree TaxID=495146 RepID=UPI0030816153
MEPPPGPCSSPPGPRPVPPPRRGSEDRRPLSPARRGPWDGKPGTPERNTVTQRVLIVMQSRESTSVPSQGEAPSHSASLPNQGEAPSHSTSVPSQGEAPSHSTSLPRWVEAPSHSTSVPSWGEAPSHNASVPSQEETTSHGASLPSWGEVSSHSASVPSRGEAPSHSASVSSKGEALSQSVTVTSRGEAPSQSASVPSKGETTFHSSSVPSWREPSSHIASLPSRWEAPSHSASVTNWGEAPSHSASVPSWREPSSHSASLLSRWESPSHSASVTNWGEAPSHSVSVPSWGNSVPSTGEAMSHSASVPSWRKAPLPSTVIPGLGASPAENPPVQNPETLPADSASILGQGTPHPYTVTAEPSPQESLLHSHSILPQKAVIHIPRMSPQKSVTLEDRAIQRQGETVQVSVSQRDSVSQSSAAAEPQNVLLSTHSVASRCVTDSSLSDGIMQSQASLPLGRVTDTSVPPVGYSLSLEDVRQSVPTLQSEGTVQSAATLPPQGTVQSAATLTPQGTVQGAATLPPEGTVHSAATLPPEGTVHSAATLPPEGTVQSAVTLPPEVKVQSTATVPPEGIVQSAATVPPGGNVQNAATVPPGGNVQSAATVPPEGNVQSAATVPPGGNVQSAATVPPGGNMQSASTVPPEGNVQSAATVPPGGNVQSAATVPPEGNMQSASTVPPGGNVQNAATVPPGGNVQSAATVPPEGNVQSAATVPPGGNVQSAATVPPGGNVQSAATVPPEGNLQSITTLPPGGIAQSATAQSSITVPPEIIMLSVTGLQPGVPSQQMQDAGMSGVHNVAQSSHGELSLSPIRAHDSFSPHRNMSSKPPLPIPPRSVLYPGHPLPPREQETSLSHETTSLSSYRSKVPAPDTLSYLDSVSLMSGTLESLSMLDDASSLGSDSEINGLPYKRTDKYGFLGGNQFSGNGEGTVSLEIARQRELKWLDMFSHWDKWLTRRFQKVKLRCRKGIPSSLRARAWQYLSNSDELLKNNMGKFEEMERQPGDPKWLDVIEKDLHRQFPFHEMFAARGGHGQQDLYRILKAYTVYRPEEGYCQAQAPVAAVLLMHMPAEQAFWCLVQICDKYLPGYYSAGLEAIQLDGEIFFALLRRVCPMAYRHLKKFKIDPILYMTEWFMCVFSRTLPWASVLRVWDMFFCEGVKIVFRVGLVLLRHTLGSVDKLRSCQGMYETMEKLRSLPVHCMQEEVLLPEVSSLPVTDALIERESNTQLRKWRENRGELQYRPSRRMHGARQIYEERLRLNPTLSGSRLSLSSLRRPSPPPIPPVTAKPESVVVSEGLHPALPSPTSNNAPLGPPKEAAKKGKEKQREKDKKREEREREKKREKEEREEREREQKRERDREKQKEKEEKRVQKEKQKRERKFSFRRKDASSPAADPPQKAETGAAAHHTSS